MVKKCVFVCAVLLLGLLAGGVAMAAEPRVYYTFDEPGPAVVDQSGNKNDGTIQGGVTLADGGYLGKCFAFNGADAYVQLNRVVQDSFALTAWIKTDTPGLAGAQAYQGSGIFWSDVAGVGNDFVVAALGTKFSFFAGNPDLSVTSDSDIVTGEWVHVAAVRDTAAKTIAVYINGTLDKSAAHGNTGPLNAQPLLMIGANTLDSRFFTGMIDEVRLYSRALMAVHVKDLCAGTMPNFLKAEKPVPADGFVGVSAPLLQWSKGETAILHNVYLGADPNLTEANLVGSRQMMLMYYHIAGLTPGATYYWRVDEIDKDGANIHKGDVWSFVAQAQTAYYPSPVDKDNTVSPTPTLRWMAGMGAAQHRVYFGANADAVAQGVADTDKGIKAATETAYKPAALESLTNYFWRVDELGLGGAVKAGAVWSFTTALVVDDFESYTDDEGARIFDTWIDGYADQSSGSVVGNIQAPFAERTIVHDANQAMPMDYNNIHSPFFSEAEREFTPAEDWTAAGVDTLVLYVRGKAGNRVAPLYVSLKDSAGKTASVVHPDGSIVSATKWVQWKIPLANFAGVNLSRVKAVVIGVGDKADLKAGGTGRIYIDDIRLAKPSAQ